jgi:hypothetical protein
VRHHRRRRTPDERRRAFHRARIDAAETPVQAVHAAYQYLQSAFARLTDETLRQHRADLISNYLITEAEEVLGHARG